MRNFSQLVTVTESFLLFGNMVNGGICGDIYGARVTSGGTLLDTYGILLSASANKQTYPSLAHGPEDQVLVIYQGFATDYKNTSYKVLRTRETFPGLYVNIEEEN